MTRPARAPASDGSDQRPVTPATGPMHIARPNAVHGFWGQLAGAFGRTRSTSLTPALPQDGAAAYQACLTRFSDSLGVVWDPRQLEEALPYGQPIRTLAGFRTVLNRLGCTTLERRLRLADANPTALPCLIDTQDGPLILSAFAPDGSPVVETPGGQAAGHLVSATRAYTLCFVARRRDADLPDTRSWSTRQLAHVRRPVLVVTGQSLLINLISLGTPLFTMAVYDFAVRAGSVATLTLLFVAAVFAVMAELRLRRERTQLIADVGSRFDAALSATVFQRLLDLPLRMTESAPLQQQLMRFRQLESIRAIFTGHIISALLDLPFLLVMIAFIFLIAGPIGFVPLGLAVLYVIVLMIAHPVQSYLANRDAAARGKLLGSVSETIGKIATIQQLGIQEGWARRTAQFAAEAAEAKFRVQLVENALHATTHAMVVVSGVTVLGLGAHLVLGGAMSVGALVATMMLIWRVLTPLQVICISSVRISQFVAAVSQVNQIMALPPEKRTASPAILRRKLLGGLRAEGVSYRHTRDAEPALRGVSLAIPAGQAVAICGPTASGKSTLLKCLAGIYEPATGGIYADGLNFRQMRIADYRTVIGYLPPRVRLFHGSVLQNLRMIAPDASEADLRDGLARAGVDLSEAPLNGNLSAYAKGYGEQQLPEDLQMRIFLAGLYARRPPILLLDDPGAFLDADADAHLREQIQRLKGKATIVIVTNRPSHIRLCDRVVGMQNGAIAFDASPEKALAALAATEAKRRSFPTKAA